MGAGGDRTLLVGNVSRAPDRHLRPAPVSPTLPSRSREGPQLKSVSLGAVVPGLVCRPARCMWWRVRRVLRLSSDQSLGERSHSTRRRDFVPSSPVIVSRSALVSLLSAASKAPVSARSERRCTLSPESLPSKRLSSIERFTVEAARRRVASTRSAPAPGTSSGVRAPVSFDPVRLPDYLGSDLESRRSLRAADLPSGFSLAVSKCSHVHYVEVYGDAQHPSSDR